MIYNQFTELSDDVVIDEDGSFLNLINVEFRNIEYVQL